MGTGRGSTGPKSKSKKKGYKKLMLSVKRRSKDIDQIQQEMLDIAAGVRSADGYRDEDAPGAGEHFCIPCSRHFVGAGDLANHLATKGHRKRGKLLAQPMYTQAEADAGAGLQRAVRSTK